MSIINRRILQVSNEVKIEKNALISYRIKVSFLKTNWCHIIIAIDEYFLACFDFHPIHCAITLKTHGRSLSKFFFSLTIFHVFSVPKKLLFFLDIYKSGSIALFSVYTPIFLFDSISHDENHSLLFFSFIFTL